MKLNSSKRNSKEDILKNVSTTPSFQKLQEKILTLQQQNNNGETIQQNLSMSCNNRTAKSNRYLDGLDECRDKINDKDFSSCNTIHSYSLNKRNNVTDYKNYSSNLEQHSSIQKLYDPLKQEQSHLQPLKPPRYHTPTRDSAQSNDQNSTKQRNVNKTDSKKSSKSLKRSANKSKNKASSNLKGDNLNIESSPLVQRKVHDQSSGRGNKRKQENEQGYNVGVSEKEKKIIQNIQKKLLNKSPISKSFKEVSKLQLEIFQQIVNKSHFNQQNQNRTTTTAEKSQNNSNQADSQSNIEGRSLENSQNHRYYKNRDMEQNLTNPKSCQENTALIEEYETNIQQNFLSNLKEKLDEENKLINEQVQKIDKTLIPNSSSSFSSQANSNQQNKRKQNSMLQLNSQMELNNNMQNIVNQQLSCQSSSNIKKQTLLAKQNQQLQIEKVASIIEQKYFGLSSNASTTRNTIASSESSKITDNTYEQRKQNRDNSQKSKQNEFQILKNMTNSSSSESLQMQKSPMIQRIYETKQLQLEDLAKTTDTRATSSKSCKQVSVPLSQEKDFYNRFSTEDKSYDNIQTGDDELFSSYSLASKSNKNSQNVKSQFSQQKSNNGQKDNFNSLYQPNQCSNLKLCLNEKENIMMDDYRKFDFNILEQKKIDQATPCSTTRQCLNGNQELVHELKLQITNLQQENTTLKNLIKKQESQSYLEKQQSGQNTIKLQQMQEKYEQAKQKNEVLQQKLKQFEELLQIHKANSSKSIQDMQNTLIGQTDKLQSNLNGKQNEVNQLKNELNSIQEVVDAQLEKISTQSLKIKNLEQLISEYSKIESKLFELEDEHEIIKQENKELKEKLKLAENFEQKVYYLMNDIKKNQQQQKSKVIEFSQVIEAYLKLTECIITESEPTLDVLVGHRRKRNSFLEIKKQDDHQSNQGQQDNQNYQQKIKEQSEFIIAYTKGSSDKVQTILDQSRTLLDKLSDYYMQKFGSGIL